MGLELQEKNYTYFKMIIIEDVLEPISINEIIIVMMKMVATKKIIFFEYLLYVRNYAKYFTCIM